MTVEARVEHRQSVRPRTIIVVQIPLPKGCEAIMDSSAHVVHGQNPARREQIGAVISYGGCSMQQG